MLDTVRVKFCQRVKKKILELSVIADNAIWRSIAKPFSLGYDNPIEHLFDRKGENYDLKGTWRRVHNLRGRA